MSVDQWWRDVASFLMAAPVTRGDERSLFAVLGLAGFDDPIRHRSGLHMVTTPIRHALGYHRQYFIGPAVFPASPEAWWMGNADEHFWVSVEESLVAQRRESAAELRRQLRSKGGRAVALDCRSMWPHFAESPELLAARMLRERWLG
jgi:hypothetical protein